ncbi:hypothetical protein FACS189499_07740 [Clostridia bacterium]|nr:hypothetical protein FACS189499_07740 [Clostridia bacterium]
MEEICSNEAELTSCGEDVLCDECGENLVFALRDNYHDFGIGISTILECLKFAEEKKAIPPLPETWWRDVITRWNL